MRFPSTSRCADLAEARKLLFFVVFSNAVSPKVLFREASPARIVYLFRPDSSVSGHLITPPARYSPDLLISVI